MEAFEQYFQVVLFIMLYKMVLTFVSVDETLVYDHSSESYPAYVVSFLALTAGFCQFKFRFFSFMNFLRRQPRSQGLFLAFPPPSEGKVPGNEVVSEESRVSFLE